MGPLDSRGVSLPEGDFGLGADGAHPRVARFPALWRAGATVAARTTCGGGPGAHTGHSWGGRSERVLEITSLSSAAGYLVVRQKAADVARSALASSSCTPCDVRFRPPATLASIANPLGAE